MATKQNGNTIPSPRPPFRRQGSSSFQNGQQEEDGDDSQTYSDLPPKRESQPTDTTDDSSEIEAADADDEENAIEPPLEDQLFAGLRRKVENNIQKVKKFVKEHDGDNTDDDMEESKTHAPLKQGKRRRNKITEPGDDEKEQAKSSQSRNKKAKYEWQPEEEADVEESYSEDVDSNDDKISKAEASAPETSEEDHDQEDEGKDEDIINDESKNEERHGRRPRSSGFRHLLNDIVPERECRRKHCPPDYHAAPRKSLLKKKNKVSNIEVVPSRQELENRNTFDDESDHEDSDEDEELLSRPQIKHNEVVALNKQRGSGREAYKRQAITNRDDHKNRDSLDRADNLVEKVKVKRFKKNRKSDSF